jgi:hypothetical protein
LGGQSQSYRRHLLFGIDVDLRFRIPIAGSWDGSMGASQRNQIAGSDNEWPILARRVTASPFNLLLEAWP